MPRFKITLEYDGSKYKGWQAQKGVNTIQGKIMEICEDVFGHSKFEFYGAGRTDAGVHAIAQVAHLDIGLTIKPELLKFKLNDALPASISIKDVRIVDNKFHARFSATARSYVYLVSKRRSGFAKDFIWWIKDNLDVDKMSQACSIFEGFKDFKNFTQHDNNDNESTMVELISCKIHEKDDLIIIHIVGSHFLWKMVRRMVGCIVEVGRNKLTIQQLKGFFDKPTEFAAQHTAPPSGLFLEHVYYEGEKINFEPKSIVNIF